MENSVFYALAPEQLVAVTEYGEAAGEGAEGMMAVANVISNRVNNYTQDKVFFSQSIYNDTGSVWHAVMLAPKQFSIFNSDDPQRQKMINLANNFDSMVNANPILSQAYNLGQLAVSGALEDNTGGATYYFNPSLVSPSWASSMEYLGQIGNHAFYTDLPMWARVRNTISNIAENPSQTVSDTISAIQANPAVSILAMVGIAFMGYIFVERRRK